MNISFLLKKKKKVEGRRIRNYKGHSMACSTKYRNTPIEKVISHACPRTWLNTTLDCYRTFIQ